MHGAGNDYIYIDCMKSCPADLPALSRRLSDRHTGVGADGMVLIMPSEIADFRMRMFNADGSEGLMCGNAARCVGKYVFEKGLTDKKRIALETPSGVRTLCLHFDGTAVDRVTVDMGCPVLEPSRIPVHSSCAEDIEIATSFGATALTAVSMGNPHGVVFCKLADVNVEGLGKELETNAVFPDRANIEFVEVAAPRQPSDARVGTGQRRDAGLRQRRLCRSGCRRADRALCAALQCQPSWRMSRRGMARG